MGNNLAKRFMSLMLASVTLFSNIGVEKVFSTPAFASENKKREKRSSEGDVPEINFTFQSQQGGESLLNLQNFNMNSSTEVDPDNKGGVYLINANNDFYVNLQMEGSMTSGEIESPIMRVKLPYFYSIRAVRKWMDRRCSASSLLGCGKIHFGRINYGII